MFVQFNRSSSSAVGCRRNATNERDGSRQRVQLSLIFVSPISFYHIQDNVEVVESDCHLESPDTEGSECGFTPTSKVAKF